MQSFLVRTTPADDRQVIGCGSLSKASDGKDAHRHSLYGVLHLTSSLFLYS
jgi:hypothetical protein